MSKQSELRTRAARRWALPFAALALLAVPLSLGTALASTQTYYLKSTGVPISFLSEGHPTATELPNHDPARDSEPGLVLARSSDEHNETDPDKYQLWTTAATGPDLNGTVTFRFWSAMKDFDPAKKGAVRVQLLDCDLFLTNCTVLASNVRSSNPWSGGATDWVQHTVDFGEVEHDISFGRSLAVKIVVRQTSDDDMWFAYDTTSYPSHLAIESAPPVTTTTTTTTTIPPTTTTTTTTPPTTTTTTSPPTTTTTTTTPPATTTTLPPTTTTTRPPTTTTTPPTTTTTQPVFGTTTTTTLPPPTWPPAPSTTTTTTTSTPATATTTPATTTAAPTTSTTLPTTTSTPPVEPPGPDGDTETEDVALAAIPDAGDADRDGRRPGGALSSALIDGLALIVPPGVAAAILSPLLLLEALVATFAATGRELVIPLATLVIGVVWIGGRWRRDPSPTFVPWYEKADHE